MHRDEANSAAQFFDHFPMHGLSRRFQELDTAAGQIHSAGFFLDGGDQAVRIQRSPRRRTTRVFCGSDSSRTPKTGMCCFFIETSMHCRRKIRNLRNRGSCGTIQQRWNPRGSALTRA